MSSFVAGAPSLGHSQPLIDTFLAELEARCGGPSAMNDNLLGSAKILSTTFDTLNSRCGRLEHELRLLPPRSAFVKCHFF